MIRLFSLFFLSLVSLGIPSIVYAAPPPDVIVEDELEDEEDVDDAEDLEDDDIDDWDTDLEEDYVPVGADGSIPLIETPSIIDEGIYTNVIEVNMEDVEEHGIDAVTIP